MRDKQFGLLFLAVFIAGIIGNALPAYAPGTVNTASSWGLEATNLNVTNYYLSDVDVTDILQYPQQPTTYIIWVDGGTYYAKHGTTGNIAFSGTNCTIVAQNAVDSMTSGGILFFKAGSYTINQIDITAVTPITICGEGNGDGAPEGTRLFNPSNKDLIVCDSVNVKRNVLIKDLRLRGPNTGTSNGIYLRYVRFAKIESVQVERFKGAGIVFSNVMQSSILSSRISACQDGLQLLRNVVDGLRSNGNYIYDNAFINNLGNGLLIDESQGNFIDSDFEGNINGVNCTSGNSNFNEIKGWFESNTGYGITIASSIRNTIDTRVYSGNGNGNIISVPTDTYFKPDTRWNAGNLEAYNGTDWKTYYDMDQSVLQASAVTFATVDTGYGANELWDMDQHVLEASAVTFATVDTGQGANEIYDMDQNVLTTSDVTFDNVTATDEITLGGVSRSTWPAAGNYSYTQITVFKSGPSGTYTTAQDFDGSILSNNTDAHTVITAAFASINTDGGGAFIVLPGIYTIDGASHATLAIPSGEEYVIKGSALTNSLQSPLSNGGSVFSFTNGARFGGNVTGIGLILQDMTFSFQGTYTGPAFNFTANAWVSSYRCGYSFKGTVINGNAGNPSSTLNGNVMNIGKVSGPTALPFIWKDNRFYDNRQGTANSSTLINFGVENLVFENNFLRLNPANTLTDAVGTKASLIFCNPVDIAIFRSNTFFLENGWTGAYANQFQSSGNDKNFYFEGQQFLNSTRVAANFYTNSGQMKVEGIWSVEGEGGQGSGSSDAIGLSVGGSGTVYVYFSGEGWEKWGSATISNGAATTGNIAHGLLGTPTYVSFTGTTLDSSEVWASAVDGTNIVGTVDGNVGGDRTVYYYARYSIVG